MGSSNVDSSRIKSFINFSSPPGRHTNGRKQKITNVPGSKEPKIQMVQWSYAGYGSFQAGSQEAPKVSQFAGRGDRTNLMINFLPQDMKEAELHAIFSRFGEIRKSKIIRNSVTGKSCCYGFVDFVSNRQAAAAQNELDGHQIRGKRLKVSHARPSGQDNRNANLYVAHLPNYMDEQGLHDLFSPYGPILDVNIMRDKVTKQGCGVAFVRYEQFKDAKAAKLAMDQRRINGAYRPITVKFYERQLKEHPSQGRGGPNQTSNGLQFKLTQPKNKRRLKSPPISNRRMETEPERDPKRPRV
ncbi:ELAV-like protein 4 [Drosophila elegans]|uniref:ELAV-like protein 4 n=1 Tax=Drosophila elegans TaxID=30023 RepID=UPI0007E6598B|nr:ELAV-like protein 4 [Drosophila elegans]